MVVPDFNFYEQQPSELVVHFRYKFRQIVWSFHSECAWDRVLKYSVLYVLTMKKAMGTCQVSVHLPFLTVDWSLKIFTTDVRKGCRKLTISEKSRNLLLLSSEGMHLVNSLVFCHF